MACLVDRTFAGRRKCSPEELKPLCRHKQAEMGRAGEALPAAGKQHQPGFLFADDGTPLQPGSKLAEMSFRVLRPSAIHFPSAHAQGKTHPSGSIPIPARALRGSSRVASFVHYHPFSAISSEAPCCLAARDCSSREREAMEAKQAAGIHRALRHSGYS